MKLVKELGNAIEKKWQSHQYNEDSFSSIAYEYFEKYEPSKHLSWTEVVNQLFDSDYNHDYVTSIPNDVPPQSLMLYRHEKFFIVAYIWTAPASTLHMHNFTGAFSPLHGSSLHPLYHFNENKKLDESFRLGHLPLKDISINTPGAVIEIKGGEQMIHRLFHLNVPSVTLLARTYSEARYDPPYLYYFPGIAVHHKFGNQKTLDDLLLEKKLYFLDLLLFSSTGQLLKTAIDFINDSNEITIYKLFDHMHKNKYPAEIIATLEDTAKNKFGDIIDFYNQSFEQEKIQRYLNGRRLYFKKYDQRLLLALLQTYSNQSDIYSFLKNQYPQENPEQMVIDCLKEMTGKHFIPLEFDDINELIFKCQLRQYSNEKMLLEAQKIFEEDDVLKLKSDIISQGKRIKELKQIAPLMS